MSRPPGGPALIVVSGATVSTVNAGCAGDASALRDGVGRADLERVRAVGEGGRGRVRGRVVHARERVGVERHSNVEPGLVGREA